MKKAANWICVASFLVICSLILMFFVPLTETGGGMQRLSWQTSEIVGAFGSTRAIDSDGGMPELAEGERLRFTAALPERDEPTYIVMNAAGGTFTLSLEGVRLCEVTDSGSGQSSLSAVLMPGGGEKLELVVEPAGTLGIFPPIVQLTDDPTAQAETMAYANYYSVPAGAMALTLLLLCGLFLLGVAEREPQWRELLLIFAAAELTVYPLAIGFGTYFFPEWSIGLLNWRGWTVLCVLALAGYLALHRSRVFWRAWGLMAACSLLVLLVCWGISALTGGYLARYMRMLLDELSGGYYTNFIYWLTWWLVLACAVLSSWELVRSIARTRGEARAIALKNQLVMENYRNIEAKLRENAALQHEFNHRIAAMDAMLQEGDYVGLERSFAAWRRDGAAAAGVRCTENVAINAIVQDASSRAAENGIDFRASVRVPRETGLPDEDICTLLMNMLDNAVEAAQHTPPGKEKCIRFKAQVSGGFLAVLCENSFDGRVETDAHGLPVTTKSEPESHGFGLAQMRAVAEKYGSILDLSWTDEIFTVQTALKLPGTK